MAWTEGGGLPNHPAVTQVITGAEKRAAALEKRVQALETALMMIRDREWVENALDPQWATQVARDALKDGD
jgi:hypothetical protein